MHLAWKLYLFAYSGQIKQWKEWNGFLQSPFLRLFQKNICLAQLSAPHQKGNPYYVSGLYILMVAFPKYLVWFHVSLFLGLLYRLKLKKKAFVQVCDMYLHGRFCKILQNILWSNCVVHTGILINFNYFCLLFNYLKYYTTILKKSFK